MRTDWLKEPFWIPQRLTGFTLEMLECLKGRGLSLSLSPRLAVSQYPFLILWSLTEHQNVWAQFLKCSQHLQLCHTQLPVNTLNGKNSFGQRFPSLCFYHPDVVQAGPVLQGHPILPQFESMGALQYICPSKIFHRGWDSHHTQPSRNLVRLPSKDFVDHLESFSSLILKSYPLKKKASPCQDLKKPP